MEIRDAADHGGTGDEVLAVRQQLGQQLDIARVAFHQGVVGVVVVGLLDPSVLGEVVDADDGVAAAEKLLHDVATDEPGRSGDKDLAHLLWAHRLWAHLLRARGAEAGTVFGIMRLFPGDWRPPARRRAWGRRRRSTT